MTYSQGSNYGGETGEGDIPLTCNYKYSGQTPVWMNVVKSCQGHLKWTIQSFNLYISCHCSDSL